MRYIVADNWEQFIHWFPEISEKLKTNVTFKSISIKCEDMEFIYRNPETEV